MGRISRSRSGRKFREGGIPRFTCNNFVYAPGKKVALIGIQQPVVIDTGDALLVAETSKSSRVNEIVKRFKAKGDPIVDYPLQVYRPWGLMWNWSGPGFSGLNGLPLSPESSCPSRNTFTGANTGSLSAAWPMSSSRQKVQFRRGESTMYPKARNIALGTRGKIPLEVIEVQIGEYLEEDDIIRFDDRYNRRINDQGRIRAGEEASWPRG